MQGRELCQITNPQRCAGSQLVTWSIAGCGASTCSICSKQHVGLTRIASAPRNLQGSHLRCADEPGPVSQQGIAHHRFGRAPTRRPPACEGAAPTELRCAKSRGTLLPVTLSRRKSDGDRCAPTALAGTVCTVKEELTQFVDPSRH